MRSAGSIVSTVLLFLRMPFVVAEEPAAKPAAPAIRFISTVYNFGKVDGDSEVDCTFQFVNEGTGMLEVTSVAPSCGCMKTMGWDRRVESGQTGMVAIRYNSAHYTGDFAKSVSVTCNDPNQPTIALEIKGIVWRPIEIKPPSAVLNLSAEVPSTAAAVQLISHLDEPLLLTDLMVSGPSVSVQVQTNQPGKEFQVVIQSPLPAPPSSQQGHITVRFSSTNAPPVILPIYVNVLPVLMAIPAQIKLPFLPLAGDFTNKFWVRNNGTNDLVLSDPRVNADRVQVQIKPDPASTTPLSVIAIFSSGFDIPPGSNLELRLKTNDPLFPYLAVPILPGAK